MAAKHTTVTRTIQALPETVWQLLTDIASYPDWNPTIVSIEGDVALGGTVRLVSAVNPKRKFALKVTSKEPPSRMVWSGGMPLRLFSGVRTYQLAPQDGDTVFSVTEEFSGPLSGLIVRSIPDLTDSFDQLADGLKAAAEARS